MRLYKLSKVKKTLACFLIMLMGLPSMAMAEANTNWATWTIPDSYELPMVGKSGSYTTGTVGSIFDPRLNQTTQIILSGEINRYTIDANRPLVWTDYSGVNKALPDGNPYVDGVVVTNTPTSDVVLAQTGYTLEEHKAHRLEFSNPVTNAVMAILSLGGLTLSELTFSQPFILLDSTTFLTSGTKAGFSWTAGDQRLFSGGDATTGYTLTGLEANGLIQFLGTYDEISWTVTQPEVFSGFTVGLTVDENPGVLPGWTGGDIVPYDLFGIGGVTAPTTFAVFEPEPAPDPPAEPEPEPQSVLERVLAQIEAATNLAPFNGIYANVAENISGANGSGVDGSITNIITGVNGLTQQAVATAGDMATTIALPTLNFGDMTTTALGAVNTGEIVLGVNTHIDDATARTTRAVSSAMTQLGGADVSGALVINIAANMTGIDGAISNTLTMVNGTIGDLSTTALGAVNTGTTVSGLDAKVQGIVGLGG